MYVGAGLHRAGINMKNAATTTTMIFAILAGSAVLEVIKDPHSSDSIEDR